MMDYGKKFYALWFIMGFLIGLFMGSVYEMSAFGAIAGGGLGLFYAWLKGRNQKR